MRRSPRARQRRAGLTVVECLIALTILSVTVLAATMTLSAGAQHDRRGDLASIAARLGRDLLEEITSREDREPVTAPVFGRETGETTRALYDDVDDYHNFNEPRGTLTNFAGVLYAPTDQQFSRSTRVTSAPVNVTDLGRSVNGLTVEVTVTSGSGERWVFTRFIPES